MKSKSIYILLVVIAVIVVSAGVSFGAFWYAMKAETNVRYAGLQKIIAEKMNNTLGDMETNAKNVFDEVSKNLDSPESVIAALNSKTSLAPDVRGYFAAFEPEFFKEKGKWFEPYVHHTDSSEFELSQVGSARHDYTKSSWYIRAKHEKEGFWSDPYFYYDGSTISGHYCTYVEPVFDKNKRLACVCGVDITFDWLTKKLQHIDFDLKNDEILNRYHLMRELKFYSVIIDKDGSCLVYPDNNKLTIKDKELLKKMQQGESGTADMMVSGQLSTLYYGPLEGIDWTLVVVTPKQDVEKPTILMGLGLLLVAVVGVIVTWFILRRVRYAEDK